VSYAKSYLKRIGFASELDWAYYEESSKPNSVNQLPRTFLFDSCDRPYRDGRSQQ
jgi:hypothetical protein